jgi:hypothetical protein
LRHLDPGDAQALLGEEIRPRHRHQTQVVRGGLLALRHGVLGHVAQTVDQRRHLARLIQPDVVARVDLFDRLVQIAVDVDRVFERPGRTRSTSGVGFADRARSLAGTLGAWLGLPAPPPALTHLPRSSRAWWVERLDLSDRVRNPQRLRFCLGLLEVALEHALEARVQAGQLGHVGRPLVHEVALCHDTLGGDRLLVLTYPSRGSTFQPSSG